MSRRLLIACFCVHLAGAAYASFDLFLAPGTDNRYHRFDPINQVNLGTMPSILGSSSSLGIAANSQSSWALARAVQGTQAVNYNTGDVGVDQALATHLYLNDAADRWGAASSNILRVYSFDKVTGASGASQLFFTSLTNQSVLRVASMADGRWLTLNSNTAGEITAAIISNSGTIMNAGTTVLTSAQFNSSLYLGQPCVTATGTLIVPYRNAAGTAAYTTLTVAGNTILPSGVFFGFGTDMSAITTATISAVRAHNGSYLVGAGAAAGTSFIYQLSASNALTNYYSTNAFAAPTTGYWSMSNVMAPEPAPWMVLGLGVIPMLRCRRRH